MENKQQQHDTQKKIADHLVGNLNQSESGEKNEKQ